MEGLRQEQARSSRKEHKCMQPYNMKPVFKDCEELEPRPEEKWTFVNRKSEAKKHHTEWCVTVKNYRCVRWSRSSKINKMQRSCAGPKRLAKDAKHKLRGWRKSNLGGHDMVRRVDRHGEALIWCRKCSGYARRRMGPTLMNRCKLEKSTRMKTETY